MKIRIKGNSVRLRLSRTEVEKLSVTGYLEEYTSFGENRFVYALEKSLAGNELFAEFEGGKLTMYMPASFIKEWAATEVTGYQANMQVSNTESVQLLVEKDFQCLDETTEDQSDNYENPNKTCQP